MRKTLKKIDQVRKKFYATFEREGKKVNWNGYSETTLLFKDIRDENGIVTDHLWFSLTKGFESLGTLKPGDVIEFEARISEYSKGYVNRSIGVNQKITDYKLSRPTKIKRVMG